MTNAYKRQDITKIHGWLSIPEIPKARHIKKNSDFPQYGITYANEDLALYPETAGPVASAPARWMKSNIRIQILG